MTTHKQIERTNLDRAIALWIAAGGRVTVLPAPRYNGHLRIKRR